MKIKIKLLAIALFICGQIMTVHGENGCPPPSFGVLNLGGCDVIVLNYSNPPASCNESIIMGDGLGQTPSNGTQGNYSYTADGTYIVSYTIGGVTATQIITIQNCSSPPPCPGPAFGAKVNGCCAVFSTKGKIPDNCLEFWDFGDNSGDTQLGSNNEHCYDGPGTYIVTHTVEGVSVSIQVKITDCVPPPCNDFDINLVSCSGFTASSAPRLCFDIDNFTVPSFCNNWTVSFYTLSNNTLFEEHNYSNTNFVEQWFPGPGVPNDYYMEICVELCDQNCVIEKCIELYPPFPWNMIEREGESTTTIGTNEIDFSVYPNPARSNIQIASSETILDGELTIFDASGRIHAQYPVANQAKMNINIADLSPGIYILELKTQGQQSHEKLIVH